MKGGTTYVAQLTFSVYTCYYYFSPSSTQTNYADYRPFRPASVSTALTPVPRTFRFILVSSLTIPFIRNRFRKPVSVLPFRKRLCHARHIGEWPGWPSVLAGEFPAHPSGRSSRLRRNGNGENRTRPYMN